MLMSPLPFSFLIFKALVFWYTINHLYLLHFLFNISLLLWHVSFKRARMSVYLHIPQRIRGLTYSRCSKITCWIEVKLKLRWGLKFPSLTSEPSDFQRFSCLWVRFICSNFLALSLEESMLPPASYHDIEPLFVYSSSAAWRQSSTKGPTAKLGQPSSDVKH